MNKIDQAYLKNWCGAISLLNGSSAEGVMADDHG
jgi:hypothetical protein